MGRFGEHFAIEQTRGLRLVDPILDSDTELFVDPLLIFKAASSHWRGAMKSSSFQPGPVGADDGQLRIAAVSSVHCVAG